MNRKCLIAALLLCACPLYGVVIQVPKDYPAIQQAIDNASNGDTVLVAPGHYYEQLDFSGKSITVASRFIYDAAQATIEATIIDGDAARTGDSTSVVTFASGENASAALVGFTITRGKGRQISNAIISGELQVSAWVGGGIFCENSSPTISNNIIMQNQQAKFGGGIACLHQASPLIEKNIIYANPAESGGGIYCGDSSHPRLWNNKIFENSAFWGGGISCYKECRPFIKGNALFSNSARDGAGIALQDGCAGDIQSNFISYNRSKNAKFGGGGILCLLSSPNISRNDLANNESDGNGGGICCQTMSSPLISTNLLTSNKSSRRGGGIYCATLCQPTIISNTIIANISAETSGNGQISLRISSVAEIADNIIANNPRGPGISADATSLPTVSHNNVWDNSGGGFLGCGPDVGDFGWCTNTNGTGCYMYYNISCSPEFCDKPGYDFSISSLSCCVAAGSGGTNIGALQIGCGPIYRCGDIDQSGQIDVGDAVQVINYIFIPNSPIPDPLKVADVDCDGEVSLKDAIYLINHVYRGGPLPCDPNSDGTPDC